MSEEQGRALARELGVPFMETSAKANINVEDAFFSLARYAFPLLTPFTLYLSTVVILLSLPIVSIIFLPNVLVVLISFVSLSMTGLFCYDSFYALGHGDADFRDIKTKLIDSAAPTSNSNVTFDNNQRKVGSGCCS